MMISKQPQPQKTATEQLKNQSVIEPLTEEANKKTSKKLSTPKSSNVAENKEVVNLGVNDLPALDKKTKPIKEKVIRDSFSFPEHDYLKISALKQTCLTEGIHVKKGELLRAGLQLLTKLSLPELKLAIAQVEKVKTGRPNSSKK